MRRTSYIAPLMIMLPIGFFPQLLAASAIPSRAMTVPRNVPQAAGSRIVTDETGQRVAIPAEVRRIVSLAPSITEMIYAMKLDDRLAGDTDYCDVPAAAKAKPHVGSVLNPSLEAIVALHPDVVLAVANSGNRKETVEALQNAGIAVYAISPRTVLEMFDSMSHIASIVGANQDGYGVVSQLRSRLDSLQRRLAEQPLVHVLFVVQLDPLITIGQNTFIADALRWAGAESIVLSKEDWPQLSLEEVVRLQPDYVVTASNEMNATTRTLKDLREHAVWKDLMAVREGHVAIISEEIDRPAPGLVDAIEQLAHQIHPDVFPKDGSLGHAAETEYTESIVSAMTANSMELSSCAH